MIPATGHALRRLLPLTAAVLAAHLWLVLTPPRLLRSPGLPPARPLITRSIEPAPVVAAVEPAPAAPTPPPGAAPPPVPAPVPANAPATPLQRAETPTPAPPAPQAVPPSPPSPAEPAPVAEAAPSPAAAPEPVRRPPTSMRGLNVQVLAIPEPSRVNYEVTLETRGLTVQGTAQLTWRHDGSQYEAQLDVGAPLLPTRTQRSTGRITDEGLAPARFLDKARTEQATHFERDKGTVVFSNNQPQAALLAGAQDRLSVVIQLSVLLGGQPAQYPAGTQIAIPTAGTRDLETWIFTVEGEEDLQLPGGKVQAIKLQRNPRKEFDQKVELWLAPRMDYAPVRLRLTSPNGDSVDQRWTSTDKG
jgi:hypothetical protein